jgi:DNA-binding CsgD family transcriptional regulator
MEIQLDNLSPLERVIVRLDGQGLAASDIARKIAKRPGTVNRILQMVDYKRGLEPEARAAAEHPLRPVERVVLALRARGESYSEIGNRLIKSGAQVRRIEEYAQIKLDSGRE